MCGIFCALTTTQPDWPSPELEQLLRSRGPDCCSAHLHEKPLPYRSFSTGERLRSTYLSFFSTVLHLRGANRVPQPYRAGWQHKLLCWNGEAWSIGGNPIVDNDTQQVFALLEAAVNTETVGWDGQRPEQVHRQARIISRYMSHIAGPYSFVFYNPLHGILYFGRDFLGRRSLLTKSTSDGGILISSVAAPSEAGWAEVEADGIKYFDMHDGNIKTWTAERSSDWAQQAMKSVPYYVRGKDSSSYLAPVRS